MTLLAICGPGTLIGDLSAIDRRPRSATVEALGDVTAALMPMAAFDRNLDANRRVGTVLTREVVARLRDADRTRTELSVHTAGSRLAARLVELADRFGRPEPDRRPGTEPGSGARRGSGTGPGSGSGSGSGGGSGSVHIGPALSQDDLAHWVGASREAVAKSLAAWRRQGLVRTGRRSVTVLDLEALRRRAA
jgi:CRP-like cAMP-binding protein